MVDQEEEAFKVLLNKKFELFRKLIACTVDHELESARVTIEQARRIAIYAHETYFRHLRLYDFVLKNAKLSEVKRVTIPIAEPKCGKDLSQAMVLADDSQKKVAVGSDIGKSSGMPSIIAAGHVSGTMLSDHLASQNGTIAKDGTHTLDTS